MEQIIECENCGRMTGNGVVLEGSDKVVCRECAQKFEAYVFATEGY